MMIDPNKPKITVADFMKYFTTTTHRIVLKDCYNGREYTRPDLHLDLTVWGCFPRIDTRDGNYAHATLVLWVEHDFEKGVQK